MKSCLPSARHSLAMSIALLLAATLTMGCSLSAVQLQTFPVKDQTAMIAAATPLTSPPPAATATLAPKPVTGTAVPAAGTPAAQPNKTATPEKISPTTHPANSQGTVNVSETVITLPTYPFRDYLVQQFDPVYNMPVLYFNRPAFEAAAPTPVPVDYTGLVVENPYLRLTFLPELGGRLYSAVVKATGQEIFYHNPVVKPSRYGGLQPVEANWWLATGGMEWAYPTYEHGYRYGLPWEYTVEQAPGGVTVTLQDVGPDRVSASVEVSLPADSAAFFVNPRLVNNTAGPVPVQFWLNAALTLGSASMAPETRFILPAEQVVIHSRGDEGWSIAAARQPTSWPQMAQADLGQYSQWSNYLGFFAPYLEAPFMGAYNPATGLAIARLIEPGQVAGTKIFAFGPDFPDRSYTDDGSQYFEIWGGANTGFWPEADVTVPPGGLLQWQEQWWPLAGLGGLTWANEHAAIHLIQADNQYTLSLLVPQPRPGRLAVLDQQETIFSSSFSANPAQPLRWQFTTASLPVQIQVIDSSNVTLLDYSLNQDSFSHD